MAIINVGQESDELFLNGGDILLFDKFVGMDKHGEAMTEISAGVVAEGAEGVQINSLTTGEIILYGQTYEGLTKRLLNNVNGGYSFKAHLPGKDIVINLSRRGTEIPKEMGNIKPDIGEPMVLVRDGEDVSITNEREHK